MNRNIRHAILLCCVLALLACGARAPETALHLIVATKGEVRLKRDGWKISIPVAAGTQLGPTDVLEIGASGEATIVCTASSTRVVREAGRNPCERIGSAQASKNGANYNLGQRQPPTTIPYPIAPRSTPVLARQPLLAWHDTGAQAYTVSVVRSDDNATIWSTSGITSTSVLYPATSSAALVPGVSYRIVVEDETTNQSSDSHPTPGGGFTLVDEQERRPIDEQITSLRKLPDLDAPAKALAEAVLLMQPRQSGLPIAGEAWLQLQSAVPVLDTPAGYLRLGNALLAIQLPADAANAYQEAIDRARTLGDLETEAEAQIGHAVALNQPDECNTAMALFGQLGDPRVGTVQERCG